LTSVAGLARNLLKQRLRNSHENVSVNTKQCLTG